MRTRTTKMLTVCCSLLALQLTGVAPATSQTARGQAFELKGRAVELRTKHQSSQAIPLLQEALKLDPDAWTYTQLGASYCELKQYKLGIPYLEKAYSLAPTDATVIEELADAYNQTKQHALAIDICQKFLAAPAAADTKTPSSATVTTFATTPATPRVPPQVWWFYARALAGKKQYEECYAAYNEYFDLKPDDPNDWWRACLDFDDPAAAKYMYPLFTEFCKRFPQHEGVKALGPQVRKDVQLARAGASAEQRDPFDAFITYKDLAHPVSKEFFGVVKEGLRSIPPGLWKPLMTYGCKVVLVSRVTDTDIEDCDKQPRGYKKGETYHNVAAIYLPQHKQIVVAEYYADEHGKPVKNEDPADAACHELAHALDEYLGSQHGKNFSHSAEFAAAYKSDAARLKPEERKELAYFLQAGEAGQEELFAELFGIMFNQSAVPGSTEQIVQRRFTTTIALVKDRLRIKSAERRK